MDNGLVHTVSLPNSVELTVLILVVVDNGLVPMNICKESKKMTLVLILVVVDNGLVQSGKQLVIGHNAS